jgi:hypothetical protein
LIQALIEDGAPVKESEGKAGARGFAPKQWAITAQRLREWLLG